MSPYSSVQQNVLLTYKQVGETPLCALERVRREEHIAEDVPMTYAGRLDPMAEGLLIILAGEECRDEVKRKYLGLDKTYEATVLFGVATDSYDLLGLVTECAPEFDHEHIAHRSKELLQNAAGSFEQSYPPYSSKTVDGAQLHTHARAGNEVSLPTHMVRIDEAIFLEEKEIEASKLLEYIENTVGKVEGDFRQAETIALWRETLSGVTKPFLSISFRISVGSGFYVRQYAHDLGKMLGVPAVLYSLKRTQIGEFVSSSRT